MPSTSELFEKQLGVFLNDIHSISTGSKNACTAIVDLKAKYRLRHLFPTDMLISSFVTHIAGPYRTHIMEKDAEFFLISDTDGIEGVDTYSGDDIQRIIDALKNIWSEISIDTKNSLWMRVQILLKLCDKWEKERG
jgi:hypothetical protein